MAGDIGSGKTSVLLAIEFALFGLQPGQKGSALLRNGKDEGSVALEIEIDSKNIKIERGLKRGKSVNQSYAKIDIDGEKKELSITELKNKVLELLNYPKEFAKKTNLLYRFTVYTPQEEMRQIILETAETRLDTLRHVFGIDKYKKIRENTDIFTINLREQIRNFEGQIKNLDELKAKLKDKELEIGKIEENIKVLVQEVENRKAERKKFELELKETELKIKEKEKYEQEAEKTKIMLLGKKELALGAENEIKNLTKQINEAEKIKFNPEEIAETEEQAVKKEKEAEEKNKSYLELLSRINSLNSRISDSENLKNQISVLRMCPTCLQGVPEDYKSNILRKFNENIEKDKKELSQVQEKIISIKKEIDDFKAIISSFKNKISELKLFKIKLEGTKEKQIRLENLEKQKLFIIKDIELLEKQIETLREAASLMKKFDSIYESKNKELLEAEKKEKAKEIELASSEKEKEMDFKIILELEKEIQDKEKIKTRLLGLSELEDWLSSSFISIINFTERNIMFKLKEEFSKLFNEWFNILVPEIFTVRLDEDFTPIIEQQDFSLDYSFLSGGERTAVALAYRLALNQVLNSLLSRIKTRDLVILDEPTDGFSEQQLDKMRDVLNELKVAQLIIVSHESKIESFVESIIKFRKVEGVTKVEV